MLIQEIVKLGIENGLSTVGEVVDLLGDEEEQIVEHFGIMGIGSEDRLEDILSVAPSNAPECPEVDYPCCECPYALECHPTSDEIPF